MRKNALFVFLLALTLASATPLFAAGRPDQLYNFKTDKKPDSFKLVKNESLIAVRYESTLWLYDAATGQKKWQAEVADGDEDGLHLVWNDSIYLMARKKGLVAFDIASGSQIWSTNVDIRMKKYRDHERINDKLLLIFEDKVALLRPADGKVLWTADFKFSSDAKKNFYVAAGDWGGRLLLLGNKGPALFDLETGKVLWQAKRDFSDEIPEPVLFSGAGKEAAMVLYDKGASGLNLKTGEETWFIDDKFEDATGLVQFEQAGGKYCLFGFKKTLVMFDAGTGKILWKSAEKSELKGRPYYIYPSGSDVLIITARNTDDGGYVTAYKVKLDTGDVLGKADIVMSKKNHIDYKIPLFGRVRFNNAWIWEPVKTPQGLLFQAWGVKTRKIKADGRPGESGGEGLVMVDPETCAVKWRAYYELFDEASSDFYPLFAAANKSGYVSLSDANNWDSPSYGMLMNFVAKPAVTDSAAYVAGNQTMLKIDLATGAVVWQGPKDAGTLSSIVAKDDGVYGFLGQSFWNYKTEKSTLRGLHGEDVVITGRKNGFFCLDSATGKELWKAPVEKDPYYSFTPVPAKDGSALFLTDGRYLRQLAYSPKAGGFGWEMDMKKKDLGEISALDGVVFVKTGSSFADWGDHYTVTTTYEHHMEHGLWRLESGDLLALTDKGPARIAPNGNVLWKSDWKWNRMYVTVSPRRVQNDKYLIYRHLGMLICYDLETGAQKWELPTNAEVSFDSKEQKLILRDGKEVTVFGL